MRLIISEKPSTAKTIAAVVGATEKEYDGKEFCYKGNGYYVCSRNAICIPEPVI